MMIGILGGMGPAASWDLYGKIISLTEASKDQEHLPVVVFSNPQIPDRGPSILDVDAPDPLPAMLHGVKILELVGASCVAIACNTAHFWEKEISAAINIPIISIVKSVTSSILDINRNATVGILATKATIKAEIYQRALSRHGIETVFLHDEDIDSTIHACYRAVKKGDLKNSKAPLLRAINLLKGRGVTLIVLGCSELPIAYNQLRIDDISVIDANKSLAKSCINWFIENKCKT